MDWVFYLLCAIAAVLGMLALGLILRARGMALGRLTAIRTWPGRSLDGLRAGWRWLESRYPSLETRRTLWAQITRRAERRYAVPWVLMLGHDRSGKSKLLTALREGQAAGDAMHAALAADQPPSWHHLESGVLIELAAPGQGRGQWRRTLRRLDEQRPERPLDGVVVTVSAELLLSEDDDQLQLVASGLFKQLWQLQKHVQLRVPVYLVVTKVDAVEGFCEFWDALGAGSDEILGWSSPDQVGKLDQQFSEGWVFRAFEAVSERVHTLQLAGIARGLPRKDAEDLLLFPQRFARLRGPLAQLTRGLFARTAYQAGVAVRGVYFTGRVQPGGPTALVHDLFEEKVFAERHLAELATVAEPRVLSRSRPLRRVQLALALGFAVMGLALAASAAQLSYRVGRQVEALGGVAFAAAATDTGCPDMSRLRAVLASDDVDDAFAFYPAMPTSLLDGRSEALRAGFIGRKLLQAQVFPALRCRLASQAAALAGAPDGDAGPAGHGTSTPLLRLAALERWERSRKRYRDLAVASVARYRPDAAHQLVQLVQGVLEIPEVPALDGGDGVAHRALQEVSYDRPVVADLDAQRSQMAEALQRVSRGYRDRLRADGIAAAAACQRLQDGQGDARRDLLKVAAWTANSGAGWLAATPGHNPCADTQRAMRAGLARLDKLSAFPRSDGYPAETFERIADLFAPGDCYEPVAKRLSKISGSWCAQFLEAPAPAPENPVSKLLSLVGLADDVAQASDNARGQTLRALADAPFMGAQTDVGFECKDPGAWDPNQVRQAREVLQSYQRLTSAAGGNARTALPGVRRRVFASVAAHLQAAQIPAAGPWKPVAASRRFARVVPNLVQMATLLRQFEAVPKDMPWSACLGDFARTALQDLDPLWEDAFGLQPAPVPLPTAGLVSGKSNPRMLFEGVSDAASAMARFEAGLRAVRALAEEAAPFARFHAVEGWLDPDAPGAHSDWDDPAIITALDTVAALQSGAAGTGSTVARLSNFYKSVLAGLSDQNCVQRLADLASLPMSVEGEDAFSIALLRLHQDASELCAQQRGVDALSSYERVVFVYGRLLRGRFPFGPRTSEDASVNEISAMGELLRAPEFAELALPDGYPEQREFLKRLRAGVALLERYTNGKTTVQVDVRFRTRLASGHASEDILNWELRSGKHAAVFPNGSEQVSWQLGQRVSLALRWADRSSLQPSARLRRTRFGGGHGGLGLGADARVATFSQAGDWALLRFLAAHRDPSVEAPPGFVPLRFVVPLDDADAPGTRALAVVHMQLALQHADGSTVVLGSFPTESPVVVDTQEGARNR